MSEPVPIKITLHKQSQTLEVGFSSRTYKLSAEYLRVFSPSAEVRGHRPDQEVLQLHKSTVKIAGIEAQGNYAIRLIFSDKHDSGIYTWEYLKALGDNYEKNWAAYLYKVAQYEKTKDLTTLRWVDPR